MINALITPAIALCRSQTTSPALNGEVSGEQNNDTRFDVAIPNPCSTDTDETIMSNEMAGQVSYSGHSHTGFERGGYPL